MGYSSSWFKPGFQTQLAISANCITAFILFGYDQGVFGGLVTNEDFLAIVNHPSNGYLGFIVASYNLGCLAGCIINFILGGRYGRRPVLWAAMSLISIGAVLQCATYGVPQLIVGRIVTGLGVGLDTSTVPTYQSELCKSDVRGRLVTSEVMFAAGGIVIAYFFAFGMSYVGGAIAWRLPIAVQIIPAIIISFVLIGLPETPRWLIQVGRESEAVEVMCQVWNAPPDDEEIVKEKEAIISTLAFENENPFSWRNVFKRDRVQTGWRVFLAILSYVFNQMCGINMLVFYITTVLEKNMGLEHKVALVAGGCVNLTFAVSAIIPSLYLDRIGRRWPMIIGCAGMSVSMLFVAVLLSFEGTDKSLVTSRAALAFILIYMLFFGASLNSIPWCYAPEILPLKARTKGIAVAVTVNWSCAFLVVMVTPTMIANIHWKTYLIFMCLNGVFAPTIYFLFPETARLTLEEVDNLFIDESIPEDSPASLSSNEKAIASGSNQGGNVEHIDV